MEEWLIRVVMAMYERARTAVRTKDGNSGEFEVRVGVHQGSVPSPLLFVVVMEVLVRRVKEGLPWELLYADDLVLIAEYGWTEGEDEQVEGMYGGKRFEGEYRKDEGDGKW